MNTKIVDNIFNGKIPLKIRLLAFLVDIKKKILLTIRGSFTGLKNQEGFEKYNISKNAFDGKNKKYGLSAFGRLKNGAEFLEVTIESHIPYCDEIILVDNNSTDNTREICQRMQKKYPKKIKIFQYKPEVYKLGSEKYKSVSENSVHSMAYYYNRVLSKTTYSHCMKLDDDHIIISSKFDKIRKKALESSQTFYSISLINIVIKSGIYHSYKNNIFAGLYGDFGIFPIGDKTYFVKDKKCENFLHPYKTFFMPTGFIHLKYQKKDKGTHNYPYIKKQILQKAASATIQLPSNIVSIIKKYYF